MGPVTLSNLRLYYEECKDATRSTCTGAKLPANADCGGMSCYSAPGYGGAAGCTTQHLYLLEAYDYNYANASGGPVPVTVRWTYVLNNPSGGGTKSHVSQTLAGPGSGSHAPDVANEFDLGLIAGQDGHASFVLAWTDPNGASRTASFPQNFYFNCG